MRKTVLTLAAACAMFVASVAPAGAITWGEFDGTDHPHVVNLLFVQNGVGFFSCTGTLLSPTVVLTAGHCTGTIVDGELVANDLTYVSNEPNINDLLALIGDYPSTIDWLNDLWVSGQAVPHPEYADFAGFPDTFDVGLVLLDEPMNVGTYGELPELGEFDYLNTKLGKPSQRMVEIVGYGLVGRIPAFADNSVWERRVGYSTIIYAGGSAVSGEQNFVYSNSPGKGNGVGGTCSGDSGGPAFWIDPDSGEPTNVIVGINSYGIAPNCNGNDYQFRTDIAATLDFVAPYLP